MPRRNWIASFAALFVALLATVAQAQYPYGNYGNRELEGGGLTLSEVGVRIATFSIAVLIGFGIGYFLSQKMRRFRRYLWIGIAVLVVLSTAFVPSPVGTGITYLVAVVGFFVAVGLGLAWGRFAATASERAEFTTFGSAKWATLALLQSRGLVGEKGLVLGDYATREGILKPLHYTGDRHLLTVAPTRAGKGVSSIIPNLLTYPGSALVIDPKGENAMTTAMRRGKGQQSQGSSGRTIQGMGQQVRIVDPWGLTTAATGLQPACFNPLDWLDPNSPDVSENALMLADSLVVATPGNTNPFWDEEAKALLMGMILYVVTHPDEAGNRNLGRVRDLLTLKKDDLEAFHLKMAGSSHPVVASTGGRTLAKEPRLKANVLSVAQSHTHFLDSPRLRESLSRSDFKFEDLKREPTTVYLVLPADRLNTFGRWLRLLIQQAITVNARNLGEKPERPILFLLDEMAALGRLAMVEQAYGLMAGFGMQLWGIVQDLSQLHRVYGDGWQTFIGNSGVLQYFGSRDKMTAEYFSDLCGSATVPTLSSAISNTFSSKGDTSNSTSHNHGETQRKLVFPDELMRFRADAQLILVENLDPIDGRKITWYQDARFKPHGLDRDEVKRLSEAAPIAAPMPSRPAAPIPPLAAE